MHSKSFLGAGVWVSPGCRGVAGGTRQGSEPWSGGRSSLRGAVSELLPPCSPFCTSCNFNSCRMSFFWSPSPRHPTAECLWCKFLMDAFSQPVLRAPSSPCLGRGPASRAQPTATPTPLARPSASVASGTSGPAQTPEVHPVPVSGQ